PVTIVVPKIKTSNQAMLFIDGGSRSSSAYLEEAMEYIAVLTGTTVVHVKNIPSQPIVFKEEVVAVGEEDNFEGEDFFLRSRSEDAIIAYSYDRYIDSYIESDGDPNQEWPLLFPMAKAAVKAMDMTQEILGPDAISGFVVSGASKRGWTTWMTGAVDSRVTAIAPIVINVLNMKDHLMHHRKAYGFWSPAIYDYAQENVFDRLLPTGEGMEVTPEAESLLNFVDPYQYSLRGSYPMPKFMLNATGDEFFVPDTAELYYHDLEGEAHLCYVPNVGHSMGGIDLEGDITDPDNPVGMLLAWYMAVTQNAALPHFTYSFEENGAIKVETDPNNPPVAVRMWQAEQPTEGLRDFRNHKLPQGAWTSTTLTSPSSVYVTPEPEPEANHYTAFFVQLEYENDAELPSGEIQHGVDISFVLRNLLGFDVPNFVFTTGVRVLPETYPEFTGYVANIERPDIVYFDEETLPVVVVYGAPYDMGHYYGQLMANDINAFIPAYLEAYKLHTGMDDAFLTEAWEQAAAVMDDRILQEIEGMADALALLENSVTLEELQLAHAAMLREPLDTWNTATTSVYRGLMSGSDAAHAVTVNGPMARDLHQYQCAVVYIPDKGAPHTVFTYAGLTIGHVAVNLGAISAVEVIEPDSAIPGATNMLAAIRSIMYDSYSLRDAIAAAKAALPGYAATLVLGDGRNELRSALLRTDDTGTLVEERYDLANTVGAGSRGIIYAAIAAVADALKTQIESVVPSGVDINELSAIAGTAPSAQTGSNLLSLVVDADGYDFNIWFSTAQGGTDAGIPGNALNMQLLLP
ncbi:MAG TPA: hypothetical protein ENN29_02930, partial [Candidatus Hydrogenedentes bacterium]|nr:hypothetical protein [Candidatus Hydrogenedentota bacterium]